MAIWEGHKAATSALSIDVITAAVTESGRVPRADRALFTACEFWAAARNRTVLEQFRDDAFSQLQAAEASFAVIGLTEVTSILRRARTALTALDSSLSWKVAAESIENSLSDVDQPVDQLIDEFANRRALDRQNKLR